MTLQMYLLEEKMEAEELAQINEHNFSAQE